MTALFFWFWIRVVRFFRRREAPPALHARAVPRRGIEPLDWFCSQRRNQCRILQPRPLIGRPAIYRRPTHWLRYPSYTSGVPDHEFIGPIQEPVPLLLHFRRHFWAGPGWYVMIDEGRGTPVLLLGLVWAWTPLAGPFAFDDLFFDTRGYVEKTTRRIGGDLSVPLLEAS